MYPVLLEQATEVSGVRCAPYLARRNRYLHRLEKFVYHAEKPLSRYLRTVSNQGYLLFEYVHNSRSKFIVKVCGQDINYRFGASLKKSKLIERLHVIEDTPVF